MFKKCCTFFAGWWLKESDDAMPWSHSAVTTGDGHTLERVSHGPLKKVWCGLPAGVFTGWKPVPYEMNILFQRADR